MITRKIEGQKRNLQIALIHYRLSGKDEEQATSFSRFWGPTESPSSTSLQRLSLAWAHTYRQSPPDCIRWGWWSSGIFIYIYCHLGRLLKQFFYTHLVLFLRRENHQRDNEEDAQRRTMQAFAHTAVGRDGESSWRKEGQSWRCSWRKSIGENWVVTG